MCINKHDEVVSSVSPYPLFIWKCNSK